jgi:high-affinity nickel permease
VSSLLAGGAIGVTHALELDHLAAVATLVEEDTDRQGLVGASWGVGHTIPIAAIGLAFVLLGLQLPETVTRLRGRRGDRPGRPRFPTTLRRRQ